MTSEVPVRITWAERLVSADSSTPSSTSVPGPSTAMISSWPEGAGLTTQTASALARRRARCAIKGNRSSHVRAASSRWVISLTVWSRSMARLRSRPSRTKAAASVRPRTSTGARLTSTGNSVPSRCQPESSRPAPICRARRFEELTKMLRVVRPATGRNERLDRLADQLFGVVAEQLGDRRARQDDPSGLVDDDDRVRGRREDRAEQVARLTLRCARHSHSP